MFIFTERKTADVAGRIYLIPVTLGGDDYLKVIPGKVIAITLSLRFFVVEELRSARRYLKLIDKYFPVNDSVFYELNEHTSDSEIDQYLQPVLMGSDMGIMSEAGLPGIADPGSKIIARAHHKNIKVTPLSGPSSIILALIASGLNGQNFSFNGYLPIKPAERSSRLKELERRAREGYAQIFMETPYRNQRLLESIITTCQNETKLCIASDITLSSESIRTLKISEWKRNLPMINDKLVIFILQ